MTDLTVLLVDAYDSSRRALADLLRETGYDVREARDGAEGLRAAGEQLPQLVIFDPFPGVSGSLHLLRALRQRDGEGHIPCVVLTAADRIREQVLAAECTVFLQKPCLPQALLALVDHLLGPPRSTANAAPAATAARAWE